MGLLKAALGAAGGVLADQWKEYFYCEAMDAQTIVVKGMKKASRRSSNKRGEENIISDGSVVAVANGQCMMIVQEGKVVELCAEPGEFVYQNASEPSIFAGALNGDSIRKSFETIGRRLGFGGTAPGDQRVYYFNLKELVGNKYGTATPIPLRVVDRNIGLDMDISVRCNGEFSYRLIDPMLFYVNVCGNVEEEYTRTEIDSMLKAELLSALQPAFAKLSDAGIRYSALPGHTEEIAGTLNQVLSEKWKNLRGLEIASFAINSITAPKEDEDMIKQMQRNAVMRDPNMAAATLVGAQAQAMQDAAKNQGGAFMGFAGMNAAQGAGGVNAGALFQMGQTQKAAAPGADSWTCSCGTENTGKFCTECATPRPQQNGWTCSCGAPNTGKFCTACGKPCPSGALRCNKCGWAPEPGAVAPKFCPQCGDVIDENDRA